MSDPMSGPAEVLARCVGDPKRFSREVWGRRSQVHGSGAPATDLLSLADVDALVTSAALRVPTFRLVKDGQPLPVGSYTTSGRIGGRTYDGVAAPHKVLAALDDGATLVLQGAHRYHPPLTLLCRQLELALGHRCQVNAYVTPAGARGLDVHSDPHDVLVLQAFGSKTWEVHPTPWERRHGRAAGPLEQVLDPGDVQYLPTGTPHAARSQQKLSGHVTVGILATTWSQVVAAAVGDLADGDAPVPAGWLDEPGRFASELAQRLEDLAAALTSVDPDAVTARRIRRFLTSRPPLLPGALLDRQRLDGVEDGTPLVRRPGAVCRVTPGSAADRLEVLLGDRRLDLPAWLGPALAVVADRERLRPADLAAHLDERSRLVLCRRLVREGLLGLPA